LISGGSYLHPCKLAVAKPNLSLRHANSAPGALLPGFSSAESFPWFVLFPRSIDIYISRFVISRRPGLGFFVAESVLFLLWCRDYPVSQ
jgi:hypothetical protein